ncbi:MAG: ATP-binding protein [Saprospiraceae bacterium]
MIKKKSKHTSNFEIIFDHVESILENRLVTFFTNRPNSFDDQLLSIPKLANDGTPFFHFLKTQKLNEQEFLTLALALIPHLDPAFLGKVISKNLTESGDFNEIGGVKSVDQRYFLPTGETVLFLLAGNDLAKKSKIHQLFSTEHFFSKQGILYLEKVKSGTPKTTGRLILDEEYIELFVLGKENLPTLSMEFPASHLSTDLDWSDLVLPPHTLYEIGEIKTWVEHHSTLMNDWGMAKKLKQGYRALFFGPSGTGKTMTATLLAKETGLEVFRIDLSMVVSKYIGETEKNLSNLFDRAENKNWILFFDEADALFGKRTSVSSALEKYANQEVSFLLQRIENHPGLVILASNFKGNIDAAFTRRFQSFIQFNLPDAQNRFKIWKNAFPKKVKMDKDIDLMKIAEEYELSGSNIMNVVQYACLQALARKSNLINNRDILSGIRKEFSKEGKMI